MQQRKREKDKTKGQVRRVQRSKTFGSE